MANGDINGDGVIDMDIPATTTQVKKLEQAGSDLDGKWKTALNKINNPGHVGDGPMGRAFMEGYGPNKTATVDGINSIVDGLKEVAERAVKAPPIYEAHDLQAYQEFIQLVGRPPTDKVAKDIDVPPSQSPK